MPVLFTLCPALVILASIVSAQWRGFQETRQGKQSPWKSCIHQAANPSLGALHWSSSKHVSAGGSVGLETCDLKGRRGWLARPGRTAISVYSQWGVTLTSSEQCFQWSSAFLLSLRKLLLRSYPPHTHTRTITHTHTHTMLPHPGMCFKSSITIS